MGNFSDIDGIIFDMDGVIFDSERLGLQSWLEVGGRHGLEGVEENARKCIGRSTKDSMEILEAAYGDRVSISRLYKEAQLAFSELMEKNGMPLKKGAVTLLKWLRENNVKTALASSTSVMTVRKELEEAGLLEYFSVIVGGDMIERSKPQPDIYLLACDRLGVRPKKTFAVEDSYNGILAAYRAGMLPLLVPDLIEPNSEMLEMSACRFNDLEEALDWLKTTGIGPART